MHGVITLRAPIKARCLAAIEDPGWPTSYLLDFNVNKSKVMIISRKRASHEDFCSLRLNNSELEYVHEYKYLGVNLNSGNGLCFSATSTS